MRKYRDYITSEVESTRSTLYTPLYENEQSESQWRLLENQKEKKRQILNESHERRPPKAGSVVNQTLLFWTLYLFSDPF